MRSGFCVASTFLISMSVGLSAHAQSSTRRAPSAAQLELSAEIAATTDEGYPAALRVTLKNIGNVAVTTPLLGSGCHPDNGVRIERFWTSVDDQRGIGGGGGCGISDQPSLDERVRKMWIHLAPGEFMTATLRLDAPDRKPGFVEYWVEFTPPDATAGEVEHLLEAGFVIPTDKLATEHRSFRVY